MADAIFGARFLLPGLKLIGSKNVVVPDDVVKSLTKDDGSTILVFLKKFEGNLGFLRDTEMLLEAMYQTGGAPSNVGVKKDKAEKTTDEDDDEKEASDDEEEDPWEELDVEFDSQPLDPLVQKTKLATKHIGSPSVEGYDCFLLKPKEVWESSKKISEIELNFLTAESSESLTRPDNRGVSVGESLTRPDNRGVSVGESFVVDLADSSSNPIMSNNVILLEWDLDCTLMKEFSSPKKIEVLKNESEIRDEILLLGVHGGYSFDPAEPLVLHVHLHDYLSSGHRNLKLKLYNDVEIVLDSKKTYDEAVHTCIGKSCGRGDPVGTLSSSGVSGGYVEFVIDPKTLLQILQALKTASTTKEDLDETNLFRVLEEQPENKAQAIESILDAIEIAQFAAVIEDDGSNNELVAKFLLSSIASNDMYFDSAPQMLKAPNNRSPEKVAHWSNITMRTAESSWDSIFTRAAYKVTRSESTPLLKTTDDNNASRQKFLVKVTLPEVNADVTPIGPKNIALLMENCDPDLAFVDKNENRKFHYMHDPVRISQSGDDHMIEFEWSAIDRGGAERNSEMKVSILLELVDENGEDLRPQKIGQTMSIVQKLGGESKQHSTTVKLRHTVKLGFENATVFQGSISNFLEATFKMVYIFSITDEQRSMTSTFLEKAADDIANRFYKTVSDRGTSDIYDKIHDSDLFLRRPFEETKVIKESELADFVVNIFQSLAAYDLLDWARSIMLDEDALELVEDNQNLEDVLQNYVGSLTRALRMDSTEVVAQLLKHPKAIQGFVTAAQQVSDEIHFPKGLEITDEDFFNESSARDIEKEAQEIVESFDIGFSSTAFATEKTETSRVLAENVSALEKNLLRMLENSAESCDTVISALEDSQEILNGIHERLDNLRTIGNNMKTLSTNARNLSNFCKRFWQALGALASVAYGPLAVIKGIYSGMKVPMKMILNALANGERKVSGLTKKVNSKMKTLVTKKTTNRIRSLSNTLGKPTTGIEKFREVIDMVISVAKLGILPISLISGFASSTSLQTFFQKLNTSISTVRSALDNLYKQSQLLLGPMSRMKDFARSIASKFNFLSPVDRLLKKLQPFVNTIKGLFNRFTGWWRRLLNGALWPIEQAINVIIYPFRRQINSVIQSLNPFGIIESLMAPLTGPLNALPSFQILDSKLNMLSSLQTLSKSDGFVGMSDSFTVAVAIIQRGFFGLLEGLLTQCANNVGVFEQLVGGVESNKTIKFLLKEMQTEFPDSTLGDLILDIKNKSIDGPMARCNSYLLMNASKDDHTYKDNFTAGLESYVVNSDYDLVHCGINPSDDKVSPLFEYGTARDGKANNSWLMAPMAVLLHYSKLTEQAEKIGALSSNDRVHISFLPEDRNNSGQYRVSLYTKISGSKQAFDVDSRLPLQRVSLPNLEVVEEIPTKILGYANERLLARVDPAFSEKYNLALVEKVVALKLKIPATESVGTGMHLLCGNHSGFCYKKEGNNTWRKYLANKSHKNIDYDAVELQSTEDVKPNEVFLDILKTRTISLEDTERLDSLIRAGPDNINLYDRSIMENVMQNVSMFVMVTSARTNGEVFPILHTDNTKDKNIIYANGARMQPLFDPDPLSDVSEIWEFAVTISTPIAEQQLLESISLTNFPPTSIPLRNILHPIIISTTTTRLFSGNNLTPIRRAVTSSGNNLTPIRRAVTSRSIPPSRSSEKTASSGIIGRLIDGVVNSVLEPCHKEILEKQLMASIRGKESFTSNPRVIKVGDYVRSKSKRIPNNIGVVIKVITKKVEVGSNTNKRVIHTAYSVKLLFVSNKADEFQAHDTEKLSEQDKDEHIQAILQHKKIFADPVNASKRMSVQKTWNQANLCGLTLDNLSKYVDFCRNEFPSKWGNIERRNSDKFVSIKNLSKNFIEIHTRGLGSGIALNMVDNLRPETKVFVSVSWDENIDEVIRMLESQVGKPLKEQGDTFRSNTIIWLAPFSLYQPSSDDEPSIETQLAGEVFKHVLQKVKDMFILQSSNCDPFSRLWCVSELLTATEISIARPRDLQMQGIFNRDFRNKYVSNQRTSHEYGWKNVETDGIKNWVYTRKLQDTEIREVLTSGKNRSGSTNYVMMGKDEWGQRSGMLQPILRVNVERGLTFNRYIQARETDTNEMKRLDKYYSNEGKDVYQHRVWWRLQKNIVELQHRSLNVGPDVPNLSLMFNFIRHFHPENGTNNDIVRRVLNNQEIKKKSIEILGIDNQPSFLDPDGEGRVFLGFQKDEVAKQYFTKVLKLPMSFMPTNRLLLSFGSKDENGFDFPQILAVAQRLESPYVDATYLPLLAGSFKFNAEGAPRNSFWMEYYKRAMKEAQLMVFFITKGWVDSPNTWEELDWTIELRHDATKYTNVFLFQHLQTRDLLQGTHSYVTKFDADKFERVNRRGQYNWKELMHALPNKKFVDAQTPDEIVAAVQKVTIS